MAGKPTTSELYKAKSILEADVVAAVGALMTDLTTTAFLFGNGYRIDLAEAVSSHGWAKDTVACTDTMDHLRRAAVRPAILLVQPEKT
jgi:hypothetical protein